ncbi:MAG: glycosyltransferase [Acidobacteria bacterium]|jgi:GT2 family glycosyltransferase|nr:glycosyltransferase [Acidobacteriota bacterium]
MADVRPVPDSPPAIAVVIATRGRPADAARAVRCLLQTPGVSEVCVIDQSDDGATLQSLADIAPDPRMSVTHCPPDGLGAARNRGMRRCTAPLVAFTDDDCDPDPGWAVAAASAFESDPRIGLVFGAVQALPYDRSAGFIPAYPSPRAYTGRDVRDKPRIEGMGACMAVRRSVWERLGGFDETFGAGGFFRSGEDTDFAIRTLAFGYWVAETPDAIVIHRGFRTWQQGTTLVESYMFGLGAANAKLLRLRGWKALAPIAALGRRWLTGHPVVDLNHLPPRLLRLRAFLRGAWTAMRMPIDPATGLFVAPPR